MKKIGFFLFVQLIVLNTFAANHYVRAGATGNGNGSDWANAYTALPSTLVRGDVYYIAAGAYTGRTFGTAASGTTLITIKKAIESDHGTATGWLSSFGTGQATFSSMLDFTTSYWLFDGQTGGGAGNNWNQNFGFKVTETSDANAIIRIAYTGTADNITIRHVDMQGKGSVSSNGGSYSNDGLAIYGASNITLSYYHMKGVGRAPFFISTKNLIAEQGWVESYYGSSAVHSEIASIWGFDGSVGDATFRYNLFTDIESTGGLMWDNSSNTSAHLYVYGNTFYKPAGAIWEQANGLVGGWTGGGGEQCHNVWVYNNNFVNVDQECLSTFPNIASGNIASNNIFYNCQSPDFSKFSTHDYNLFINSGGTHSETNGASAATDPFVNAAGFDFHLKAATPAGQTLASPFNTDLSGTNRGGDGVWDRGAYEFGSSGPAKPTITSVLNESGITCGTFTYTIAATNNPTSFDATSLPAGLSINKTTGVISGTPSSVGTTNVTISATNATGTSTATLVIVIGNTTSAWTQSIIPANPSDPDNQAVELGMKFRSDVAGSITGIRFYKGSGNTGTHIGNLWTLNGTKLATVTFTGETATGWQQANFATPVAITAGTIYVVSYYAPASHYAADVNYFTAAVDHSPIHAVANSESPNGLYLYATGGGFPTQTFNATNYWVDVVFSCNSVSTGIEQVTKENIELSLFPNPANTSLKVQSNFSQEAVIKIYDALGKEVFGKNIFSDEESIDVSALPNGIYFLQVRSGNNAAVKKFLIQH